MTGCCIKQVLPTPGGRKAHHDDNCPVSPGARYRDLSRLKPSTARMLQHPSRLDFEPGVDPIRAVKPVRFRSIHEPCPTAGHENHDRLDCSDDNPWIA